jgi:hypothetical protein
MPQTVPASLKVPDRLEQLADWMHASWAGVGIAAHIAPQSVMVAPLGAPQEVAFASHRAMQSLPVAASGWGSTGVASFGPVGPAPLSSGPGVASLSAGMGCASLGDASDELAADV